MKHVHQLEQADEPRVKYVGIALDANALVQRFSGKAGLGLACIPRARSLEQLWHAPRELRGNPVDWNIAFYSAKT